MTHRPNQGPVNNQRREQVVFQLFRPDSVQEKVLPKAHSGLDFEKQSIVIGEGRNLKWCIFRVDNQFTSKCTTTTAAAAVDAISPS